MCNTYSEWDFANIKSEENQTSTSTLKASSALGCANSLSVSDTHEQVIPCFSPPDRPSHQIFRSALFSSPFKRHVSLSQVEIVPDIPQIPRPPSYIPSNSTNNPNITLGIDEIYGYSEPDSVVGNRNWDSRIESDFLSSSRPGTKNSGRLNTDVTDFMNAASRKRRHSYGDENITSTGSATCGTTSGSTSGSTSGVANDENDFGRLSKPYWKSKKQLGSPFQSPVKPKPSKLLGSPMHSPTKIFVKSPLSLRSPSVRNISLKTKRACKSKLLDISSEATVSVPGSAFSQDGSVHYISDSQPMSNEDLTQEHEQKKQDSEKEAEIAVGSPLNTHLSDDLKPLNERVPISSTSDSLIYEPSSEDYVDPKHARKFETKFRSGDTKKSNDQAVIVSTTLSKAEVIDYLDHKVRPDLPELSSSAALKIFIDDESLVRILCQKACGDVSITKRMIILKNPPVRTPPKNIGANQAEKNQEIKSLMKMNHKTQTTKKQFMCKRNCKNKNGNVIEFYHHLCNEHTDEKRNWACPHEKCFWSIIGFTKRSEVVRHILTAHGEVGIACPLCTLEGVPKEFSRQDSLKRHIFSCHLR